MPTSAALKVTKRWLERRWLGGKMGGFNLFGINMDTRTSRTGDKRVVSRAEPPIKIGPDEFVVYQHGDLAEFKKSMRNYKSPALLRKGQLDVLGHLRAARDGDCSY